MRPADLRRYVRNTEKSVVPSTVAMRVQGMQSGNGLSLVADMTSAVRTPLDQRVWVEGNLSVDYGSDLQQSTKPFGLIFDPGEMAEALCGAGFVSRTAGLQALHLGEVDAVEHHLGRVESAETAFHELVEVAVVGDRGLPAHAADDADGLHGAAPVAALSPVCFSVPAPRRSLRGYTYKSSGGVSHASSQPDGRRTPMQSERTCGTAYLRFFAMIATSMAVMHLLMYVNSADILGHARISEMRILMTVMMGASMTVVMLAYMRRMYTRTAVNVAIFAGAIVVFAVTVFLICGQVTVTDTDYMQGMIPHHSIAILTSENAQIEDVCVRALADAIIDAQEREIREMEWLIEDISVNGLATTEAEAEARPVPVY